METLMESLSGNECCVVLYNETQHEQLPLNANLSAESFDLQYHAPSLNEKNNPLIAIQSALSAVRSVRYEFQTSLSASSVCPYQKTLTEYLGSNFVCPSIQDLSFPLKFNPNEAVASLAKIDKKYNDVMFTHLQSITAEAASTDFAGITSQHLGNAFALLSTTANGQEYIIDRPRAAKHLELAELIRNISTDYILQNPVEVAQKLVSRFIEIHQD